MNYLRAISFGLLIIGLVAITAFAPIKVSADNPTVSILSLSPGTDVNVGAAVTFIATAGDFTNPNYNIIDSFNPTTITSANINAATGVFNWTPASTDAGSHNIAIIVTDSLGHTASVNQIIKVATNSLSVTSISANNNTIATGETLIITTGRLGGFSDSRTYTVTDSFPGTTMNNSFINSSGTIIWYPALTDIGQHVLTITVTDSNGHTASASQSVIVIMGIIPPVVAVPVVAPAASVVPVLQLNANKPTFTFSKFLSQGAQNNEVKKLQKLLAGQGFYAGPVTGYFGALTKAAVKKFQTANNISPFGYVGPGTRLALNAGAAVPNIATAPAGLTPSNTSGQAGSPPAVSAPTANVAGADKIKLLEQTLLLLQAQLNKLAGQ